MQKNNQSSIIVRAVASITQWARRISYAAVPLIAAALPAAAHERTGNYYDSEAYAELLNSGGQPPAAAPVRTPAPANGYTAPAAARPAVPQAQPQPADPWAAYYQKLLDYQAKYQNKPGYPLEQVDSALKIAQSHMPINLNPGAGPVGEPALPMATNSSSVLYPTAAADANTIQGTATWYGGRYIGRHTASGAIYDPTKMTAAYPGVAFGTPLEVTDLRTGKTVRVIANDRGNFDEHNVDLSKEAFRALGENLAAGRVSVRIRVASSHGYNFNQPSLASTAAPTPAPAPVATPAPARIAAATPTPAPTAIPAPADPWHTTVTFAQASTTSLAQPAIAASPAADPPAQANLASAASFAAQAPAFTEYGASYYNNAVSGAASPQSLADIRRILVEHNPGASNTTIDGWYGNVAFGATSFIDKKAVGSGGVIFDADRVRQVYAYSVAQEYLNEYHLTLDQGIQYASKYSPDKLQILQAMKAEQRGVGLAAAPQPNPQPKYIGQRADAQSLTKHIKAAKAEISKGTTIDTRQLAADKQTLKAIRIAAQQDRKKRLARLAAKKAATTPAA